MTTPHRRDRLGICQNCGSGVTAIDLVDGALPCRRTGGAVMAGDLDLTEAIEAGKRAYLNAHTVSDAKAIRAAIEAAAPIIARQVAERIAERIENHSSQHEIQPSEKDCDVCYGLEIAADIAREVGSDG